jgi:probable tail fiber protein|nr:MAG TPA: tail collar fiber protein [Caudoviricetes sp.]
MAKYISILTDYGTQALAKALANNQPLRLMQFAVGDGNGQAVTPNANRTALVNEKHRANVSAVTLDPRNNKQIIVELSIPENVGGFFVREMGVFDEQNKLIAYANTPESYKPTLESGSGKIQVLRMVLMVSSSNAVTLSVDNSVIFVTRGQLTPHTITATTANSFDQNGHSHAIDKASTTNAGIVQLTDDTGLDSDKLGLTARAGKKLAQWIANLQLALNNYIPLKKRSSAVNSDSNENVATSAAVKTAYDKGVEAKSAADNAQHSANDGINRANNAKITADAAQRTANDANNNANTRQLKSELVGEVAFFARSTPPSGWLKANGAAVSRTTYAALFDAIGTTFGVGDGRTTFNLPDLRGEFIRGLDDGRNIDGGRGLGTVQVDAIKTHTITVPNSGFEGRVQGSWFYAESGNGNNNQRENTITYNGENETRPRNVALLACIKY